MEYNQMEGRLTKSNAIPIQHYARQHGTLAFNATASQLTHSDARPCQLTQLKCDVLQCNTTEHGGQNIGVLKKM